ncbi:MAG: transposase [Clostridiales bacterium]|nr:transposase [Clostridiales bacterium]
MPDDILVSFIEDQDETLAKLLENFGLLTGGCLKNESCTTEEDNKITIGTAQTVATDGINRKAWPPQNDNRTRLNRILWIARSGVQWRELSEVYGPWQSMYT